MKAKEFRFVGETVQKGFEPEKVVFPERPQGERPVARAPDFFHAACGRHSEVRRAFVALDGRFAQVHRGREREGTPRGLHDRVEYDAAQGRNGFGEIGEALEHARQRNACFGVLQSSLREKRHGVASRSGHERRAEVGLCAVDDAARSRLEDRAENAVRVERQTIGAPSVVGDEALDEHPFEEALFLFDDGLPGLADLLFRAQIEKRRVGLVEKRAGTEPCENDGGADLSKEPERFVERFRAVRRFVREVRHREKRLHFVGLEEVAVRFEGRFHEISRRSERAGVQAVQTRCRRRAIVARRCCASVPKACTALAEERSAMTWERESSGSSSATPAS